MQFETTSKICLVILCLLCVSTIGLPQSDGATFFMKKQPIFWRPIKGYEDLYLISNYGEVKTIKNLKTRKPSFTKGYFIVILCKNSKTRCIKIHRLVAMTWIPNPKNLPQVNHIDCDKLNNYYLNLEWCTQQENVNHAKANNLLKTGEQNGNNHLTISQVKRIKNLYSQGASYKEILKEVPTSKSTIYHITSGQQWKNV